MYQISLVLFFFVTLYLGYFLGRHKVARLCDKERGFKHLGCEYSVINIGRADNPANGTPEVLLSEDEAKIPPFAEGVLDKIKFKPNFINRNKPTAEPVDERLLRFSVAISDLYPKEYDCIKCYREAGQVERRMVLCPECGNKRCPKAINHELKCTSSNAVGQTQGFNAFKK